MIASLSGTILHRDLTWLILDVGGVGYQIFVPRHLLAKVGDRLQLFCSHQVREESSSLYGFMTLRERSLFELLLSVSGVGPKSALAILGIGAVDRVEEAIIRGDPTLFETVPGIGKKAAAKIIVELKSKVGGLGSPLPVNSSLDEDVIAALETLGYRRADSLLLVRDLPADLANLEEKIRWALRHLAQRQ